MKELDLEIFKRVCISHYFELETAEAFKKGRIKTPIYLSLGEESIPAALSMVLKDYYIFAQHRAHSIYLSFGGDPKALRDELLGLPSGCTGGIGGSPMIHSKEIKMIGHNGLIGEHIPLGVGMSLATKENVVCFFGDGAAEEDYVMSSVGFAATHKLPVLFVCVDNELSILTPINVRRSWKTADVAKAYGVESIEIDDDPWKLVSCLDNKKLPLFINCKTCRHLWHSGAGCDGPPKWDRFELIKDELFKRKLLNEAFKIEFEVKENMHQLWN